MVSIACFLFVAYLEKRSCCRPDQISTFVPPRAAEIITRMGYLSTLLAVILASGKTALTQDSAVAYSCCPPSAKCVSLASKLMTSFKIPTWQEVVLTSVATLRIYLLVSRTCCVSTTAFCSEKMTKYETN